MQTANKVFRKVDNYTHFKGWFAQFQRKCNILEIFHYFQYFERFRSMKKWQISKPKIVDWYLDFSKVSYTTLKSVISSFNICFESYGQLKRKRLRPKVASSTFLKFELSSLNGATLKTRKNTIRNQFEQQWFNLNRFQKPRRVHPTIWYNLKPFANMKGRFKLRLSQSRSLVWCGRTRHERRRAFARSRSALVRSRLALTVALRAQKLDLWASLI